MPAPIISIRVLLIAPN